MTQQDFARMTAVIDELLRQAGVAKFVADNYGLGPNFGAWIAKQEAAADLLSALPVPEDE